MTIVAPSACTADLKDTKVLLDEPSGKEEVGDREEAHLGPILGSGNARQISGSASGAGRRSEIRSPHSADSLFAAECALRLVSATRRRTGGFVSKDRGQREVLEPVHRAASWMRQGVCAGVSSCDRAGGRPPPR